MIWLRKMLNAGRHAYLKDTMTVVMFTLMLSVCSHLESAADKSGALPLMAPRRRLSQTTTTKLDTGSVIQPPNVTDNFTVSGCGTLMESEMAESCAGRTGLLVLAGTSLTLECIHCAAVRDGVMISDSVFHQLPLSGGGSECETTLNLLHAVMTFTSRSMQLNGMHGSSVTKKLAT